MVSENAYIGPMDVRNLGELKILEIAQLVRELTGSRLPLVHLPLSTDDQRQQQPNVTLAMQTLGWKSTVQIV
jgi:UDP-glucuronate decarboxylase